MSEQAVVVETPANLSVAAPVDIPADVNVSGGFKPTITTGTEQPRTAGGQFASPYAQQQVEAAQPAEPTPVVPEVSAEPADPAPVAEEPAVAEAATPEVPAEASPATEGSVAEATSSQEATAPELVMIEVPEGHPLRDRGVSELPATAETEREVRRLLNDPVRRAEVDALKSETYQLRQQAEEYLQVAELGFQKAEDFLVNFELLEQIYDTGQRFGEEAARRLARAALFDTAGDVEKVRAEAKAKVDALRARDTSNDFVRSADNYMRANYPLLSHQERITMINQYVANVERGSIDRLHADTFKAYVQPAYDLHPRVLEKRAADAKAAQEKAAADAAAQAEAARVAALQKQANPIGRMPTSGIATGAEPKEFSGSVRDFRRDLANGKAIKLGR